MPPPIPPGPHPGKSKLRRLRDAVMWSLAVLFIAYGVAAFTGILKLFNIPTSAMSPTIEPGDHLLATRFKPGIRDLSRGQTIVFNADGLRTPDGFSVQGIWVKRIAALPGDIVSTQDEAILVNGERVEANGAHALAPAPVPGGHGLSFPFTVAPDQVFVLGDNFKNSLDSRYIGPIDVSRISYRPLIRVYPFQRAGKVP